MLNFIRNLKITSDNNDLLPLAVEIYKSCFDSIIIDAAYNSSLKKPGAEQLQLLCSEFDTLHTNQDDTVAPKPTSDDIWIFGYGSLVWKADFPFIDRRRGFIRGYKRRFYQHSIDHRGVPTKPGRVVTLMPGDPASDRVYGVAYRIAAIQKRDVLDHLDYREKNGYERCSLEFYEFPIANDINNQTATQPLDVIMYVATQANDSYAGDVWQVPRIAEQIFSSAGPSGPNRDYLFNLDNAMMALFPGATDDHLNELVAAVRERIERDEPVLLKRALCKEIKTILKHCLSETRHDVNDELVQILTERLETLRAQCCRPGWREAFIAQELNLLPNQNVQNGNDS